MLNRRSLLTGASLLALLRPAWSQPAPIGGAAGVQKLQPGPAWTGGGAGPGAIPGPSLDLNFSNGSPIDPRITFTRASTASYFDVTGTMQSATNNVPRFDFDPVTHAPRGLLIEEARTNSLENSTMAGAVAGTPGTLPAPGWVVASLPGGIASSVIGTGTENGAPYIDLRFFGTTTNTGGGAVALEGQITAVAGQSWSWSSYLRLSAGTLANLGAMSVQLNASTNQNTVVNFVPTGAPLTSQRTAAVSPVLSAGATWVRPYLVFAVTSTSVAVDFTLRIGAPQLELGAFPTTFIPTTTVAVTRAGDAWTLTPAGSLFNAGAGTLATEAMLPQVSAPGNLSWAGLDNGAGSEVLELRNQAGTSSVTAIVFSGGANKGSIATGTISLNTPFKAATVYDTAASQVTLSMNGGAVVSLTPSAMPVALSRLGSGLRSDPPSGWIRRVRYWPRALSSGELQGATQ